jgi:hypothetical protein
VVTIEGPEAGFELWGVVLDQKHTPELERKLRLLIDSYIGEEA